ncbi:MAG: TonB-dependent receptor [Caldimicrobium sp.]|nr:TonB-dependent receptor [Caldimicrobium sp.]MCX7873891.1 TonB-dependent receptor [Caldimicrobium sp.]MDW8094825.1 TonB-dependent receptor [Caldimicrobium sp.]
MSVSLSAIVGLGLIVYTGQVLGAENPALSYTRENSTETITLEEVKIFAAPLYETIDRTVQEVKVIKVDELKAFGYESYSGLDLRERGGLGVQEDISIRGSTFEQNLILFEGVRVSDLQTGHHLMNLPFTFDDLSALEIISGGISPAFGPGGLGGALNFLLAPAKKGLNLKFGFGSYDYWEKGIKVGLPIGDIVFNFSYEQRQSNGFIWNRDFDIRTLNLYTKEGDLTLFYGYVEKDFGARHFYTPRFDSEWEETRTHLFLAKRVFSLGNHSLEPAFLFRKNYDYYLLDRRNPLRYQNKHQSSLFRFNLPWRWEGNNVLITLGLEGSYETLDSSRLGEYVRRNLSLYGGARLKLENKLYSIFQMRYDYHVGEKDFLSMGTGFAYALTEKVNLRGAINYSHRLPSVTELRYQALGIRGNPDLTGERALNLEGGLNFRWRKLEGSLTAFYRKGQNLIDWVFNGTHTVAQNLNIKTLGFTFDGKHRWKNQVFYFSFTALNHAGSSLTRARYHGNYLKQNLFLGSLLNLPYSFQVAFGINYQKRFKQEGVFLTNLTLNKKLSKNIHLAFWTKNLLDEKYYEIKYNEGEKGVLGIPQWIGIRLEGVF